MDALKVGVRMRTACDAQVVIARMCADNEHLERAERCRNAQMARDLVVGIHGTCASFRVRKTV
jgi:hypothetical protein